MKREDLPNDVEQLKDLLLKKEAIILEKTKENIILHDQVAFWKAFALARKTEKKRALQDDPRQLWLFNEAEAHIEDPKPDKEESVPVAAHQRKRGTRKPLPECLERKVTVLDIPEEEKICGCGSKLKEIRREVSEKLHFVPAQLYVERIERPIYACPTCEGTETPGKTIKMMPMPPQLITHGIATPSLVSCIIMDKFADALPLYRQSKIWERVGIDISRANMSRWILEAAKHCQPLYDRLLSSAVASTVINMDETPVQVLKEPERQDDQTSYMWVMCTREPAPVRLFHYDPSRGHQVAENLLEGFQGYLQTDGLVGYKLIGRKEGIVHVSCLAHIRRKFADVIKTSGKNRKHGVADTVIDLISKIYQREKMLRSAHPKLNRENFLHERRESLTPIFSKLHDLIEEYLPQTPPKTNLGKALNYAHNQWSDMLRFLEHEDMTPDNNIAENAIRPFVIGRKNWLFAGSPRGAKASALFYTLIETAKANELNPQKYLDYVLERIVEYADFPDVIEQLLPWNYKKTL